MMVIGCWPIDFAGRSAPASTPAASTRYISTVRRPGQAALCSVLLLGLWIVVASVPALTSCSSPPTATVGDDEFVGHPGDNPETTDSPPPRHGAIWYRIEILDDGLSIRIRLLEPPSTATFFMPGPWAGDDEHDRRITIEEAVGSHAADALPISVDAESGRIDIDTDGDDWLELSYRVSTEARDHRSHRFAPWHDDSGLFAYGPTIFVLPSSGLAGQLRDIPVELHAPPDWTLSATWPAERRGQNRGDRNTAGFVAEDIRELRDAFVAAGASWTQYETTWSDAALRMTLTADFEFPGHRLHSATAELARAYLDRFGHYNQLSALVTTSDDGLRGTGRRGGFVLEVPADHEMDDALLILLAHEAFHMWNGHRLVPDADAEDDTRWFKEGLTHYIGIKTLARLGLIDDRSVREELARATQFYMHNPIVAGGNIRAIDRTRLPYDRGLLIALALDVALYEQTGGQLEVEDWITAMLAPEFADDAAGYDPAFLRERLRDATGDEAGPILDRYDALLRSERAVDTGRLFERLGLHYLDPRPGDDARLLPLDGDATVFDALFNSPDSGMDDD